MTGVILVLAFFQNLCWKISPHDYIEDFIFFSDTSENSFQSAKHHPRDQLSCTSIFYRL